MANLAQIHELREKAMRAISRARTVVEKSEGVVAHAVQTVEVGGTAFGFGVAKGRFGSIEVLGMPVDMLSGVGTHLLAFLGGGKYAEHLHNMADGALASYLTDLGKGVGADWRANAAAQNPAISPGATAAGLSDGGLSDAELVALQQAGLRRG